MINIRTMKKLQNGDGFTLKNGKLISYKTGWQVADHGVECTTPEAAMRAVKETEFITLTIVSACPLKGLRWKLGGDITKFPFSVGVK